MSDYKSYDYTEMTEQQVFDRCATHLLEQGIGSYTLAGPHNNPVMCVYRGHDGKQCGASIFMPDDEYNEDIERYNWTSVVTRLDLSERHCHLINMLQGAHDSAAEDSRDNSDVFLRVVKRNLRNLAEEFNLSTAIMEKV